MDQILDSGHRCLMLSRPDPHLFNERVWLADLLSACKESLKTPKYKESLKLQKALKKVWTFTHELNTGLRNLQAL